MTETPIGDELEPIDRVCPTCDASVDFGGWLVSGRSWVETTVVHADDCAWIVGAEFYEVTVSLGPDWWVHHFSAAQCVTDCRSCKMQDWYCGVLLADPPCCDGCDHRGPDAGRTS